MNSRITIYAIVLLSGLVFVTCVSKKKLDEAEVKIQQLTEKGVPDSLLSPAKVYLEQAKTAMRIGNSGEARKYTDSLQLALVNAENQSSLSMEKLKPIIDSLRKSFDERKAMLSGAQLRAADSLLRPIDSLLKMNWYMEAQGYVFDSDTIFNQLIKDEEIAKTILPKVIGTWTIENQATSEGANAIEKKTFKFNKDMTLELNESMKGQTASNLKQDWQFLSWGTYSLKGDTIIMSITREKSPRQIYTKLVNGQWVQDIQKPYDMEIKDGKKDRTMAFSELQEFDKK